MKIKLSTMSGIKCKQCKEKEVIPFSSTAANKG